MVELTDSTSKTGQQPTIYNWCALIEERCKKLGGLSSGTDAGQGKFVCADGDCVWFREQTLSSARNACLDLARLCTEDGPVIPFGTLGIKPNASRDELLEKIGEIRPWHDLPAFYELSGPLMGAIPKPHSQTDPLRILYFCSGGHVAPFETALQALEKTDYKSVEFTYTEIDEAFLEDGPVGHKDGLIPELAKLEAYGLKLDGRRVVRENARYKEHELRYSYLTRKGETKQITLKFVIGKEDKEGNYPPYFTQDDFNAADIVIQFDSENANYALNQMKEAVAGRKSAEGKILIMENRPGFRKWADSLAKPVIYGTQRYGCGSPYSEQGGLRPAVYKLN